MKILYIAPENVVGNLNLWQMIHRMHGNECRFITYFPSQFGFPDDICLNLPLVAPKPWFIKLREFIYKKSGGPQEEIELAGVPPIWQPGNRLIKSWFSMRDVLWRLWVEPAIKKYNLLSYDLYHLETGLEFYRSGSFVRRVSALGKPILNTFHGVELRHRGVIPEIDRYITLNLTSELDLLPRHPNLKYLHLPYDVTSVRCNLSLHKPLTLCHATRNRYFKGSDRIIEICYKLEKTHGIRFIFIENLSHAESLHLKNEADIYIDQVSNIAPGYGMNSIEAMATGAVCLTNMDADYQKFMPDHPFVHVTPETLETELIRLIESPDTLHKKKQISRSWVEKYHSLEAVGNQLYAYYRQIGMPGND
ncbi:MAG: glycosyltransferase [FCB group bacterium]|nr:glycosyltransferase [FCB group bacterium]